jgi:predicted thioesterase
MSPSKAEEPKLQATILYAAEGRASFETAVSRPLTTVHLSPDRAVLTTPAMIGLMEHCVGLAESEGAADAEVGTWQSAVAEIRHRAGLKTGEPVILTAKREGPWAKRTRWSVTAAAGDGRLIGEGVIERVRVK